MDMMLLGETIRGKSGVVYYGFWMPSGGDEATGAVDVVYVSAANKFTVKLQTKNTEDADPATASTNIIGSAAIAATGVTKFDSSGAKQLVRYVVTADDTTTDRFMHFQLMQPQWVPN